MFRLHSDSWFIVMESTKKKKKNTDVEMCDVTYINIYDTYVEIYDSAYINIYKVTAEKAWNIVW